MTNDHNLRLVPDDGDSELTAALRRLYAAPDDAAYWSALERRILGRIANGDALDTWWTVPAQWARIGLIAAGFALIVAGSLLLRSRAEQRQMAYESVLGPSNGGPTIAIRDAQSKEQASLNYINGR
ncbi:MAG: hypothetical protein FJ363_09655 [Gemmatimonadetes bacterium]|nr:hypothetical protein [Gemmatimonadota bacterium]